MAAIIIEEMVIKIHKTVIFFSGWNVLRFAKINSNFRVHYVQNPKRKTKPIRILKNYLKLSRTPEQFFSDDSNVKENALFTVKIEAK